MWGAIMGFIKEFKEFAMKGNVVDMAVGIIIGGAFGKIITSVVNDIIMPPIGMLLGGVDFKDLVITLKAATADVAAVQIRYGMFINTVIDFIIIALSIFVAIKAMNSMKKKEEVKPVEPAAPPKQEVLLTEIRDLLSKKK
jgi:large conductance mechanosensitive channel